MVLQQTQDTDESNPYHYSPELMKAAKLPTKITDKYILFFSHEGSDPHVGLQQWFPASFHNAKNPYIDGDDARSQLEFPTTEHYIMYHKALLMGDSTTARAIMDDSRPSPAKQFGRQVKPYDGQLWKREADRVVEAANLCKFSQNQELREMLLQTGDRVLVEASPEDRIWGIGFNSEDAIGKEDQWGENRLGKALMAVRERLQKSI